MGRAQQARLLSIPGNGSRGRRRTLFQVGLFTHRASRLVLTVGWDLAGLRLGDSIVLHWAAWASSHGGWPHRVRSQENTEETSAFYGLPRSHRASLWLNFID